MGNAEVFKVTVVYSAKAREVDHYEVDAQQGWTIRDVLESCDICQKHGLSIPNASEQQTPFPVGIWMKLKTLDTRVRPLDRIEIYRPLQVDPKEARRQRYKKQKSV